MYRAFLILMITCMPLLSCSSQKALYKNAQQRNTIPAYEQYLSQYTDGKYADQARQNIADIRFANRRDSVFTSLLDMLGNGYQSQADMISIAPNDTVLMGTPIRITLQHLPPLSAITLHVVRNMWGGRLYAFATYRADANGQVHLNRDGPGIGTFMGVDSLGLFWSMTWPPQQHIQFPRQIKELPEHTILLYLEADQHIVTYAELVLQEKLPQVVSKKIRTDSMAAIFNYPRDATGLPGLVFLGGGEGGYDNINRMAQIMASHGYAVLSVAYFNKEPLPKHLEKVPLEYLFYAIDWLQAQTNVDSGKILTIGGSRGGELALQVAALCPDVHGCIAVEPSCVRWQGLPHSPGSVFFPKAAWTLHGKSLPYLKHNMDLGTMMKFGNGSRGINLMKLYEGKLEKCKKMEKALIPVENINGPILLVAGLDGQLWPAYRMCRMIEARLDSLHFAHPVETQYYANTGHYVTITPDLSPTIQYRNEQVLVGGTNAGNAASQIQSWNYILDFLDRHFKSETMQAFTSDSP